MRRRPWKLLTEGRMGGPRTQRAFTDREAALEAAAVVLERDRPYKVWIWNEDDRVARRGRYDLWVQYPPDSPVRYEGGEF